MRFFILLSFLIVFSCMASYSDTPISKTDTNSTEIKDKINYFELDSTWEIIDKVTDTNLVIVMILSDGSQFTGLLLLRNKISKELFLMNDIGLTFINHCNWWHIFKVTKESLNVIEKKKDLES